MGKKSMAPRSKKRRRLIQKVSRKKFKAAVRKAPVSRPVNDAVPDGPYLLESSPNGQREAPAPDNGTSGDRTHDMNEKMLAHAYRRGVRVLSSGGSSGRDFLSVLRKF